MIGLRGGDGVAVRGGGGGSQIRGGQQRVVAAPPDMTNKVRIAFCVSLESLGQGMVIVPPFKLET
jgi:hypothetical protein